MDPNNAPKSEGFSMLDPRSQTAADHDFVRNTQVYFDESIGTSLDKLRNFSKYVPRQNIANFLTRNEIFQKIVNVHGAIIECGVFLGGGLMSWAELSAIYEPYNHTRRILGFDTFEGFPAISDKDGKSGLSYETAGGLATRAEDDIRRAIALYDSNRPIGHIPRVKLVPGDACKTIPEYLESNKHLVVALLYLDFDLYEPTRAALEHFLPRMPKGSVVAFDELYQEQWPGETLAVNDVVGIRNLRIQRFPFMPQISFAVLE